MRRGEPKHQAIFEILQREIATGKYANGPMPSEMALCRRFGASRPTVARALDSLRQHGLIERRRGAGTFVRHQAPVRGGWFGLIGAGIGHTEILQPICAEIERAALAANYRLIHGQAGAAESDAARLCQEFLERGVNGVFLAPLENSPRREAANGRLLASLRAADIATVLIDRDALEFPGRSDLDLVAIDDVRAGYRLASHLLKSKRRRLAYVSRANYPCTSELRISGCRAACAHCNAEFAVHIGDPCDRSFVASLVRRQGFTDIVCANDLTAAQLVATALKSGFKVPHEVRIAGFDDVQQASASLVPLTTMRMPWRELGAMAVRLMLERIAEKDLPPRQVLLDSRLVVRKSAPNPGR